MKKTKKQTLGNYEEGHKLLYGFRSTLGIANFIGWIGGVLIVIGIFCPICTYSVEGLEILGDAFSVTASYFNGEGGSWIDIALWVTVFSMALVVAISQTSQRRVLKNVGWREKSGRFTVYSVLAIVLCVASICAVSVLCMNNPESTEGLEETAIGVKCTFEAGFYLYAIGLSVYVVAYNYICTMLRLLAAGRIGESAIFLSGGGNAAQTRTLTEKLNELQTLRESGMIGDEEFEQKRRQLLDEYK